MDEQPQLHSSIVSLVSLAAGIAAKHPDMGQCQLERLRQQGVPQHQIDTVIEIARHIRDEATEKLDAAFDAKAKPASSDKDPLATLRVETNTGNCGCTPTPGGQSCC